MSVELPFSPVDGLIRKHADGLRVSTEATDLVIDRVESHGAELATRAAEDADADGRKTLMTRDFGYTTVPAKPELELPIAPVDRIARRDIDDRYRVSMDARLVLTDILEDYIEEIATNAALLARHADRRTITVRDIETYFELRA